jgi:hypothetical protein
MGAWCEAANSHNCYATTKQKEKTGAKTQSGRTVMGSTMQKKRIFVIGEVFFLDISLLMGATVFAIYFRKLTKD